MAQFTKEWRDQHWKLCRFSVDPRTCSSAYKEHITDPGYPICRRDNMPCDARFVE